MEGFSVLVFRGDLVVVQGFLGVLGFRARGYVGVMKIETTI